MRRFGHGLVLARVLWSTTSLDHDPRLMLTKWLFNVQPFPADGQPMDGWTTEGECKAALERHMTFLKDANESYTSGQWNREDNASVSRYFPTKIITVRNRLECRQQ